VTKSGVNTQNITIRDEQGQQALTGKTAGQIKSEILTSVTTDTARENSGALQNNFDKDKVQSEINLQMDVTKNFDANRQEAKAEINKKIDDAKKENQSIIDKQKQGLDLSKQEQDQLNAYNDKVENYQRLGVLLDSISTGLSAPTSSGLGIATATLSPAASYKIGQYFKEQASNNPNGQLTSGQEAAHILAHTVLGAAVAAAGGNNALTAGLSAGGAEAAAPILSSFLYGKDAKDLTADQKSTISSIVGLAGSAVGATTGDIGSIVQNGQVAQNAVENNFLSVKEAARKNALIYKSKHEELSSNEKKELAEINRKDKARDEFIKNVCQLGNVSSSACQSALQAAWSTQADYNADIANNLKNRDVYSQDAKHLDQLLKGLSQDQVLGLQAIERIAKTSGRPIEEVAKEYDRAMALHGVVSTLAGFYGGKAISVEKVKNGGGSFNALTEAEKQRALDNIANSKIGRESSNFKEHLSKEDLVLANKAEQELISEINKFKSNTQAEKVATMIGAYDPKTGKTAVGFSNKKITADNLHPTTVNYIEKQLGVKIGEFTTFCKNKAGACAEVSAADSLIRQGAKPENIKFTDAIRPKAFRQEKGNIKSDKVIIETCSNCQVTWPKGTK
jgi:filamentous hemagglutinin